MEIRDIGEVAGQLATYVELTMNPNVSQQSRMEAYNACENFKEKSPICVQCGLYLAQQPHYSHFVRHFGLQLMEHCIKYRWYNLTQDEKIFIKENAMKLVECGMDSLLVDKAHMRDALSRVIVEMIKREWPQQWSTLLAELNTVCNFGCVQTELVLLILLRLVEDVAVLQNLESNQRRKDIYQALVFYMADLFSFFRLLIEKHLGAYQANALNSYEANAHARVVQVVLLTLSGFLEWVSMAHIMAEDGRLLQIFCLLLNQEPFQDGAAECLLQIVSRKGKPDERRPLLILFSEDAMRCIFSSADTSKNYQFLKKLTRVLTGLGTQLSTLWLKNETSSRPANFEMYLEAIITFTRHPSLTLVYYANSLWHLLMKHEHISKDEVFVNFVPKWVEVALPKIIKVKYPISKSNLEPNSPESYAALDYDAIEEFNAFLYRYRTELLDTLKQATLVSPLVTYAYVERWLETQLQLYSTESSRNASTTELETAYLEWEALTFALDAVLSKLVMAKNRPPVSNGLNLLNMCLNLEHTDPFIISYCLSCISALFVFVSMAPPETASVYLPRVLDKIFATLVFTLPGETMNRSRSVKNLRRHAASLMVKIAMKYPLLLLPVFSRIHDIVVSLQNKPETLSTMEVICLQEALLLISNHLCDYERQTRFIAEVVSPIFHPWVSMSASAFISTQAFMSYIGLDKPPVESSSDDINGQNRYQIKKCLGVIYAVVKRCMWPSDPELAARGGFLVHKTEVGNPIYRNPATPHILPLVPGLLAMCHVLNGLSSPQALAVLPEGFKGVHMMLDAEKQNLLGIGSGAGDVIKDDSKGPTTVLLRMQTFLSTVQDDTYHILASCFHSLSHDIYHMPNIAHTLISTVFSNIEFVPDSRLRGLVRIFLKSLVNNCPVTCHETVLLPVLAHFTPFMYTRLNNKWHIMMENNENGSLDEENTDSQEILDDMLNRSLTREYVDVLKAILYGVETEEDGKPQQNVAISELGAKVCQYDVTCQSVTLCLLNCLLWADSAASLKCTNILGGVINYLKEHDKIGPELAAHIMSSVLLGLQQHGQHDANQGSLLLLGAYLYGILRCVAPNIIEVFTQIPDVNLSDLQKLDDRMLNEEQKGVKVDKAKKEMFRKVTSPLIGRNVGQLFRRKVVMRDLPKPNSKQKVVIDSGPYDDDCLLKLFKS